MTEYRLPLTAGAQYFTINLDDVQYRMTLIYRDAEGGGWFLDMVRSDGTDAIYGIPLILDTDILAQHHYKHFGHLRIEMEGGLCRRPTYKDMGSTVNLIWTPEDAG